MTPRLLIATIGGSPEPIVASLLHWRPTRVIFIVSTETRDFVAEKVVPGVQAAGWQDFDDGRYDLHPLANAQDYTGIVAQLRSLDERVAAWLRDHPVTEIVADITGGTKAMTAGLALAAIRWPCRVSYVGGAERTKGGVGIVISGREQIVQVQNPWDALGYLAVDEAIVLFNHGNFSAAAHLLENARDKLDDASRKQELNAFSTLCALCEHWERFEHASARAKLNALHKNRNHFSALLGEHRWRDIEPWLTGAATNLDQLIAAQTDPAKRLVVVRDLLGNAKRRIQQGAFDDAVARVYRAIEALAQTKLHDHGIADTGTVSLEKVPEPLRSGWQRRERDGGLMLGLQDDYALLDALGDELGGRFKQAGLADPQKSPLCSRNSSILAHGYTPVGEKVARQLYQKALALAGLPEADLTVFPMLKS